MQVNTQIYKLFLPFSFFFPIFSSFWSLIFLFFLAFHLPLVPANTGFSCFRDDFPDDFHDFPRILMILELFWDDFACWIHDFDGFESFPRLGYGYRTSDMADMSSEITDLPWISWILNDFEMILLAEYMILIHFWWFFRNFMDFTSFQMIDMCLYECYGMF